MRYDNSVGFARTRELRQIMVFISLNSLIQLVFNTIKRFSIKTVISLRSEAVREGYAKVLLHMEWCLMLFKDQLWN